MRLVPGHSPWERKWRLARRCQTKMRQGATGDGQCKDTGGDGKDGGRCRGDCEVFDVTGYVQWVLGGGGGMGTSAEALQEGLGSIGSWEVDGMVEQRFEPN